MMQDIRVRRSAAIVVAATLAIFMLPGLVAAHSELVTSVPAQGATVPSPFTGPIVLTFSEHLAKGSKADLLGPDGATVAQATVDAAAMTMSFALTAPLAPGPYQIRWLSIADDGDLLRQPIVTFTVAAAPSPSPTAVASAAPSASAAPTAPPASAIPTTAATPAPSASGDPAGSSGNDVVLPIIVALVVLAVGAAYLLSRRNRPTDPT
jgi:methionine-rich copper-binding protein CopC